MTSASWRVLRRVPGHLLKLGIIEVPIGFLDAVIQVGKSLSPVQIAGMDTVQGEFPRRKMARLVPKQINLDRVGRPAAAPLKILDPIAEDLLGDVPGDIRILIGP